MAFWQDTNLEPKRSYRFTLSVAGGEGTLREFLIEQVTKPSFSITESEVKYLNHTFYYPGRLSWNDISFTVIDCLTPVDANATATLVEMLEASGYNIPEGGPAGLGTISKKRSLSALGQIKIHQYNSEGSPPAETWVLNNAWIKDVQFGELSYDSDDMQKVQVTLRYDNAYVTIPGRGNLPTGASS